MCGYFRQGKISRIRPDISRWSYFHDITSTFCTLISSESIKSFGFYLLRGRNFREECNIENTRKLTSRENFLVYSIVNYSVMIIS